VKKATSFSLGFLGFIIVLVVAFALNGILGIAGFEKTYRDSLVSQYSIQGEALKGRIETALSLGKRIYLLDNQIDDFFFESMRLSAGISHFYVADNDNRILYSTRSVLDQRAIPFAIGERKDLSPGEARPASQTVKFLDSYYICIPLYSENAYREGTLLVEFSQESISSYIMKTAADLSGFAALFVLVTVLAYVILFLLLGKYPRAEAIITVSLLLLSQLAFTARNYAVYNKSLSEIFGKNMGVQAKSLAEDFQKLLDYDIRLESMGDADSFLAKRIEGNPQCSDAYVTDINLNVIYHSRRKSGADAPRRSLTRQDADLTILPLSSAYGNGYLVLQVNRRLIDSILRDMALDSGTIILVALIFAFILKEFLSFAAGILQATRLARKPEGDDPQAALSLIKISTFLFMFASFETLSFIPLLIQRAYQRSPFSLAGFNEQTIISLPVGSYMLGIMLAMFITLFILDSMSIRHKYMIMTGFFIAGSAFTIWAGSFPLLILARLVAGFGFGGVLLSTSSLVITFTDDRSRSQGFGTNAAAFAAAAICSIPIGGIIVNKFGYATGIWVSIIFAALFFLFSIFCIPEKKKTEKRAGLKLKTFMRILSSRHVITYILCINVPFQLIYVGLFQFLLPLYMNDSLALSQGNIGRILSVFSIVSLGAAWVSRISDRVKKDNLLIAVGAFCVGIMMILFKLYPAGGLMLFIGVMAAMGLDNVFIDAIEEVYVASGKISDVSEENLLQSYKTIEKIISVIIPTVTGLLMLYLGFSWSMLFIGIWSAVGAALFVFLGKNGRWEKENHEAK
jgi:predicted MFS family arabinose efflux permease